MNFYLRQYLGTQIESGRIERLTTGWGGDHMLLYVDDATGEIVWILYQIWDTPEDATEFAEAYKIFLNRRFEKASDDGTCWSGDVTICFTQIDEDETRISYAINADMAMQMLTFAP